MVRERKDTTEIFKIIILASHRRDEINEPEPENEGFSEVKL